MRITIYDGIFEKGKKLESYFESVWDDMARPIQSDGSIVENILSFLNKIEMFFYGVFAVLGCFFIAYPLYLLHAVINMIFYGGVVYLLFNICKIFF